MGAGLIENIEKVKSWDHYFYNMAATVASNSKCMSRMIGAVLVRDKRVVSTGYNGPPVGVPICNRRWEEDKHLRELYAEQNNLQEAEVVEMIRKGHFLSKCPRRYINHESSQGLEWCVAGHAEENAIVNAARLGTEAKGTKMYMTCNIPCSKCLVKILNAGIDEIIVTGFELYDGPSSSYLMKTSGLKVRKYNFI